KKAILGGLTTPSAHVLFLFYLAPTSLVHITRTMSRLIALILISNAAAFSLQQINSLSRQHGLNFLSSAQSHWPQTNSIYQAPFCSNGQSSTFLRNDLRDEIEKAAQRRAYENRSKGEGVGETAAGAILGGLLGGPFGALFGAQIGASFGQARTVDKARVDEMKRKGITPEMLDMANEVGVALKQSIEGLRATQDSIETSQRLAKTLDKQSESFYERAKNAIESGDEELARKLLMERESVKEKLVKVLKALAEDRKRLSIMQSNVEALEARGLEIESLLRRSVGASALKDSSLNNFALEPKDPLLQKFKDLEM
ncbi:hypothetical protein HJC23_013057, partial [Cyclotella cryptica]